MKDYKTINKRPKITKYPIEKMDIAIKGKILYVVSSDSNSTFVLTGDGYFYVINKGKLNDIQGFELKSDLLDPEKVQKSGIQFQTDKKESQIWCNKYGTHVIIKYKNVSFYYNPLMTKKIEELSLNMLGNTFLQPYAVAFNDDFYEPDDTGKIIFSDYYSVIYELQLKLSDEKEMIRLTFGKVFSFKREKVENAIIDEEIEDFDFFQMDENDRILDMKLMVSENPAMGVSKGYNEDKNIFILAITKHCLFQFYGKNSFQEVFENYSLEDGKILKAYKKFISQVKLKDKYSRIQLLNEEKSAEVLFGFMTQCGYIMGKFKNTINIIPQKNFRVIKYYKPIKESEDKIQVQSIHRPVPKTVCQSKNHIFFLYHDCLVIQNKLTKRIVHDEYLPYPFLDMYYNQILNGIILYNETGIYKIPLELEFRYLYEDYIEIGNFETALAILTKDDKNIKPKLHKIYADYLFEQKKFKEAAYEYAFSDEIFEHVCMKFLSINHNEALIKYLSLVSNLRLSRKGNDIKAKDNETENIFIEKYLINTWILELLFGKTENEISKELSPNIKEFIRSEKEFDLNLLYYILNIYGKEKELIDLAANKQDYETIILYLIKKKKIDETLEKIKIYISYSYGIEDIIDILKKLFFRYAGLFIKEYPKETIDILMNYFKITKNPEDIIKILISPNYHILSGNSENFKEIIEYIKKLKLNPIKENDKELDLTKDQNLHNLFILLSAYSKQDVYKRELIEYLKKPIESYEMKKLHDINISDKTYFDLYFAKKIFENKDSESDIKALCLILYLLKQYSESIALCLNNKFTDLLALLPRNIPEQKLKKKIYLQIFENKRQTGNLSEAKKIITESNGIIKIEDILPLMGDNVKINEFKDELQDCISNYEKSQYLLTKEIKDFNDSNASINRDIELSEKRATRMFYSNLRCQRCFKTIKSPKFFMFPCHHIFDAECLIDTYKEFNKHNLGDKNFKNKVKVITDLHKKIKKLKDRKQKSMEEEQKTKEVENLGALQKLKTLNIKTLLSKDANIVQFSSEEESTLKYTQKILYDYLNEECLLCGKEMIDSTQIDFGDENDVEWELI